MVSKVNSERVERAVQRLLSLAPEIAPPVPIEAMAQARGITLRFVPYDGDMKGLLLWEDGAPVIGVNTCYDAICQRFTIAHELAHIEQHHHHGIHIDRNFPMPFALELSVQNAHYYEIEANVIAAQTLLPSTLLEADLHGRSIDFLDDACLRALADRYQVSLQTLLFRLHVAALDFSPYVG
jgi:Zn-dependent peptidase ImmA (M78 family)